jgi:hypothetical protein
LLQAAAAAEIAILVSTLDQVVAARAVCVAQLLRRVAVAHLKAH